MLRDHPDFFSSQERRSALVLFVYSLCQMWPGLECIWGDITEVGFYFDFRSSQALSPDFSERAERVFSANQKIGAELRPLQRLKDNAADWFDLLGQSIRAEIIRKSKEPMIDLAALNQFLEPCSGEIAKRVPAMEISLQSPSMIDLRSCGQRDNGWRIQGIIFHSRQSKAHFVKKKQKPHLQQLKHLHLGRSLGLFELDMPKQADLVWLRRGMAMRERLTKWWTALQRINGVDLHYRNCTTPCKELRRNIRLDRFENHLPSIPEEKSNFKSYRMGNWQLIDSCRQEGQLEDLFAQRYFWGDRTDVFCAKEKLLIEFNAILKLIELMSRPFDFESIWSITAPQKTEILFSSGDWQNQILDSLKTAISMQRCKDSASIKAQLMVKSNSGCWWPTGFAQLHVDRSLKGYKKRDQSKFSDQPFLHYSLMGDFERYLALIIEINSGRWPTWFAAASLVVIAHTESMNIDYLMQRFAINGIDLHFQFCSDKMAMHREIDRAFWRKETLVASLQDDGRGGHLMHLHCAVNGDMGQIDSKSCADLADESFFAALANNVIQA